jgi:hypothetical protein
LATVTPPVNPASLSHGTHKDICLESALPSHSIQHWIRLLFKFNLIGMLY